MSPFRLLASVAGATIAVAALALAQAPRENEPPKADVKAEVEVVILELDLLAVDRKEHPVLDLKPQEVEIKVDGKVRPIEFFEAPRVSPATGPERSADADVHPAGTTAEIAGTRRDRLNLLFFIDLEGLPREAIKRSADSIRSWVSSAPGSPHVSVIRYFNGSGYIVRDETSLDRIEDALARRSDTFGLDDTTQAGATATGYASTGNYVVDPIRNYEERKRTEEGLVKAAVYPIDPLAAADAVRALMAFIASERVRLTQELDDLGVVAGSFAELGGRRQIVFFSEGLERVPGLSAWKFYLEARASKNTGRTGNITTANDPFALGPAQPLTHVDEFLSTMAASGVRFIFVDPVGIAAGLPIAEKSTFLASRNEWRDQVSRQDLPRQVVLETGGLFRGFASGLSAEALGSLLLTTSSTYRVGVRLEKISRGKPYKVTVDVKRKGVTALAQSRYTAPPAVNAQEAKILEARRELAFAQTNTAEARRDARSSRVERLAATPIGVSLVWKGKIRADERKPGKNIYRVEVTVPYADLKMTSVETEMMASVRIAVEAVGIANTDGKDAMTVEETPTLAPNEVSSPPQPGFVRSLMLTLPPGRYRVSAAVTDLQEERAGTATVEVTAAK